MPPTPVLHTPRLVLRPLRSKDAPVIQKRFANWEVVRWLDAKVPWPYPADGATTFVAAALAEMARGEKSHWALVPKKGTADLIGVISLWPDDGATHDQRGFWLDPAFQGRGLMTEAMQALLDYCFEELSVRRVQALINPDNTASIRLAERLGFRCEGGPLRDYWRIGDSYASVMMYGLIAGERKKQA